MQDTHIELSPEELKLIDDGEFFKSKNKVTHKIEATLAVLAANISEVLEAHADRLPNDILKIAPKISRGEQYLYLPWLILDYPRIFSSEDVFAFRSMFWWGKHFSFTVHLSGSYFHSVKRKLADNISMLRNKDFYLCISKDQWQHHFEESNYKRLDDLNADEIKTVLEELTFLKLARKLPLHSFSKLIDYGEATYKEAIELLY